MERPRLVQRLDEGLRLGQRLTLISAPAGFGKTTLLSEWVAGCERPVAPGARATCPSWLRHAGQGACAPGAGRTGWLSLDEVAAFLNKATGLDLSAENVPALG